MLRVWAVCPSRRGSTRFITGAPPLNNTSLKPIFIVSSTVALLPSLLWNSLFPTSQSDLSYFSAPNGAHFVQGNENRCCRKWVRRGLVCSFAAESSEFRTVSKIK